MHLPMLNDVHNVYITRMPALALPLDATTYRITPSILRLPYTWVVIASLHSALYEI